MYDLYICSQCIQKVQLRWAGHVTRMEDVHRPKAVFFSELQEGKCDSGAPRKRYEDQLKRQLAQAGINHHSWQHESSDRDSWRSSVRKTSCEFETERHKYAKEKRRRQKERAASLPSSSQTFVCPKCSRGCASRIGVYSHQRACKNWPSTFPTILVCEEWAIIHKLSAWTLHGRCMTRIMVSVRTLNDKVYNVVSVLNLHGQCSSCIIIIVAVTCSFFASRDDSQTTHSYAIILTDSKEQFIKKRKAEQKARIGIWQYSTYTPNDSSGYTHRSRQAWVEGNDRADRLASNWRNYSKYLTPRKIWSVEELETLRVSTKPRTLHHRSPGGDRQRRRKC